MPEPLPTLPDGTIDGPTIALLPITGGQILVIEDPSGMFVALSVYHGVIKKLARCADVNDAVETAIGTFRMLGGVLS